MDTDVLRSLEDQVDPAHAALIIVDVQKDFCADDGTLARRYGLNVSSIQAAVPILNDFIQAARKNGIFIVWLKEICSPGMVLPNYRAIYGDELDLVREGSDGAEFYEKAVPPLDDELIITKWNYDGFEQTELDRSLQERRIKTLVMTGFTTSVCVETTARHGYLKGYYIVLVSDCCSATDPKEHESSIMNIGRFFGKVATSTEIASIWNRMIENKREI